MLYASSDASDTDFVAKLVDVHPDGVSYNMAEGMLRARYRDGVAKPSLLAPGQVYRMEIDLVGTSVAFRKGHRIRVHVTSSHFPQFDRNPNTGAPFGTTERSGSPSKPCTPTRASFAYPAAVIPRRTKT